MERETEVDPVIDVTVPGSETDQADGSAAQIPFEDSLVPHVTDDVLEEGYSPPDYPPRPEVPTAAEQREGESLDDRLAEEEPEADDAADWGVDRDTVAGDARAGRLTAAEDDDAARDDVTADDAGIAGGAASAEEAAVHMMEEESENP